MKNIFTITFLLLVATSSFSQIELIDTNKSEVVSRISYVYLEKVGDNLYNFFYKNMNSVGHEYENFSFNNIDNDIDKLYTIFMNGFEEVPRDPLKMKANGDIVWLKYTRDDGQVFLQIQQYENEENTDKMRVSRLLTAEDVTNLFKK
ncbi:hypothetical protein C7447_102486 [Tenacibaculum adriaticum]|uniref:DUF4252 domain-containing protein n=1 Tax=Tenacibaculum adriaticum TaxID=413713 RepID=A0A5S5DTG9_9FLAO|nr:hypothetical protein [Tenacibaculum adriaticum]TYP99167.1 hypothetical protein C7447_102486 [Tenacibaculum adriaticum]